MPRQPRVLAIASGGGHWVQLLRVAPAFDGCDLCFATVRKSYRGDIPRGRFRTFLDATRWNKARLAVMAMQILWIVIRERPTAIVSTGAAPGYFAFRFGKFIGARTLWIDSIANAEELSMTGRIIAPYADLRLTQWEHLAVPGGPVFAGSVV